MKKMLFLAGEPGVGKSTVMKEFMQKFSPAWTVNKSFPLVPVMLPESGSIVVLGTYGDEIWGGTDRLSLSVQPKALEYVRSTSSDIVLEGDRLFTQSFLRAVLEEGEVALRVILLNATDLAIRARHKKRGDTQSQVFIKGRRTKIIRILHDPIIRSSIVQMRNETPADRLYIIKEMKNFLSND